MNATEVRKAMAPRDAVDPDLLFRIYRAMVLTRALDERGLNLQRQGRISFYAPSTGQEASMVGSAAAFDADDWFFPSYREVGVAVWRGAPVRSMIAHLFGNQNDLIRGRQMPSHFAFSNIHFVSVSSPIGTQIIHAVGAAVAMKYRRTQQVSAAFFGDGATSSNDFHCGMNFAGVYKAPVVFVCQNNGWAITVPIERQTAQQVLAEKAEAYGFEGVRVDGNDAQAVYLATHRAAEKARSGGGPTLIEALTYRMGPHTTSDDPRRYRSEEALAPWKARDPIERLRVTLVDAGLWTTTKDAALLEEVKAEVGAAVEAEEKAGHPPLESLFADVFAGPGLPWNLREQMEEARRNGR